MGVGMPVYMVTGADAETAEDRAMEVEAATPEGAAEAASAAGLLVHRVYPIRGDGAMVAIDGAVGRAFEGTSEMLQKMGKSHRDRVDHRRAKEAAWLKHVESTRVSLRPDWGTINAIACGVLLGLVGFSLLGCFLSLAIPGLAGAVAGAGAR